MKAYSVFDVYFECVCLFLFFCDFMCFVCVFGVFLLVCFVFFFCFFGVFFVCFLVALLPYHRSENIVFCSIFKIQNN